MLKPSHSSQRSPYFGLWATLALVVLGSLLSLSPRPDPLPVLRLATAAPGVYRVSYEALVQAGVPAVPAQALPSTGLHLSNHGMPVPIWIEDGHDGSFGPGDWLTFVAERLAGDSRYFHEYTHHNIYWLSWDNSPPARMVQVSAPITESLPSPASAAMSLSRTLHLEHDQLFIRLAGHEIETTKQPELWFWAKLTHIDPQPFSLQLDLSDLDPHTTEPVRLRLHFRAVSQPIPVPQDSASALPPPVDHRVEVALNGIPIGAAEWNGKTTYTLDVPPLAASQFQTGPNTLSLRVPARTPAGQVHPLVDVVMLDWLEARYAQRGVLTQPQTQLTLNSASSAARVSLTTPDTTQLPAYGPHGSRIPARPAAPGAGTSLRYEFTATDGPGQYHLVRNQQFLEPVAITRVQPSRLRDTGQRADYLMISHARLRQALEPLAAFHRRRGLRVAVIDVQDIYDEFNHGIIHPRAIRDFIAHAYHHWTPPAPRFVLLVGDASWDTKNPTIDDANYANWPNHQLLNGPRFGVKPSTVYGNATDPVGRNLMPTWNYSSPSGHTASDNYFVTVADEDEMDEEDEMDALPDLAIGRLPVTEPAEVAAIVAKTIRHIEHATVGPWRRDMVWIASEQPNYQQPTEQIAARRRPRVLLRSRSIPSPMKPVMPATRRGYAKR